MLRFRPLSAGPEEITALQTTAPVAASPEEARLLEAVSKAASDATTEIVFKGLVGFAGISVAGMLVKKLGMGFLSGALLVSGVSYIATSTLKPDTSGE